MAAAAKPGRRYGAAAAVKRTAQVQHCSAKRRVDATGLVVPALPVEGDLERVLHRQRTTLDEEQMRQRRVSQDSGKGLDEVGHRHRIDVGVAGLVQRRFGEFGAELLVVGQRRMIHTQRRGCEKGEHVQVAPAVSGIDQIRPHRPRQVEHQVKTIDQNAAGQHLMNLGGPVGPGLRTDKIQGGGHDAMIA